MTFPIFHTHTMKIELSSINLKIIRDVWIMGRACNYSLQNRLVAERERSSIFAHPTIQQSPLKRRSTIRDLLHNFSARAFSLQNSLLFVIVDVDSCFISLILVCCAIWRQARGANGVRPQIWADHTYPLQGICAHQEK